LIRILEQIGARDMIKTAILGLAARGAALAAKGIVRNPGKAVTGAFFTSDTMSGAAKMSKGTSEGTRIGDEAASAQQVTM